MLALASTLQAGSATAQDGQSMRAPLPPQRPYDLDLPVGAALPQIIVQSPAAPDSPASPASVSGAPAVSEPDEDEGPEWPQLTPGQKAGAEPEFDPERETGKTRNLHRSGHLDRLPAAATQARSSARSPTSSAR